MNVVSVERFYTHATMDAARYNTTPFSGYIGHWSKRMCSPPIRTCLALTSIYNRSLAGATETLGFQAFVN